MSSPADIYRTFHDGQTTWVYFLSKVKSLPHGLWPAGSLNPYIALVDVPRRPTKLPRLPCLYGRPVWRIRMSDMEVGEDEDWDPELISGRRVELGLAVTDPTRCEVSEAGC